jgi:hypothetical protein
MFQTPFNEREVPNRNQDSQEYIFQTPLICDNFQKN